MEEVYTVHRLTDDKHTITISSISETVLSVLHGGMNCLVVGTDIVLRYVLKLICCNCILNQAVCINLTRGRCFLEKLSKRLKEII